MNNGTIEKLEKMRDKYVREINSLNEQLSEVEYLLICVKDYDARVKDVNYLIKG